MNLASLKRYYPAPRALLRLLLGVAVPLLLAGSIAEDILEQERFAFEQPLMLWLHEHSGALLTHMALVFHYLGKVQVAALLAILFALWQYRHKQPGRAIFVLLGTALPALIMLIAKLFFNRPRPELWPRLVVETSASFPSGHSTFAAAFATLWVLIYWRSPHRRLIIAAAVLFALAMGISRMILGVHYPTDVLVGWLTGMSTVLGLYTLMRSRLP